METLQTIFLLMAEAPLKCWAYLVVLLILLYIVWGVSGIQKKMIHNWTYQLEKDFVYKHRFFENIEVSSDWFNIKDGEITIYAGYSWDGCTPKYHFLGLKIFGTPDGVLRHGKPWLYFPSLVHDCLIQFNRETPLGRHEIHNLFKDMMHKEEWPLANLYFRFVWWFGPKKLGR